MLRDERFYLMRYDDPRQRMIWEPMLNNTSALYPIARRDPVFTPLFTAVLGTGGFSIGAATFTYASIASAVATAAISIGLQMLLAPKPPKPEDGKVPITQAVPYRHWIVGRVRAAGAFMLWEARGDELYSVQAVAGHKCKGANRFWLHDDEVEIDGSGVTTEDDGEAYGDNVTILTRNGAATETSYGPIITGIGNGSIWSSLHRGDGQASMGMIARATNAEHQNERFPYGAPRLSAEWDGAYVWDFRDPAQSPTNPATWVWSRNGALILAWHLCFSEFGERKDYTKAILPVIEMWKEEADICDENVPLKAGGTEKRYWVSGWATAENDPKVATNAILSAMDGWICYRGDGAVLLTVGKFRESRVSTLTDRDIVGYQIQNDVLFEDECNRLIPKFTYPETDYSESDTDYFEDAAAQLQAGRVLAQEADYGWCHQWRQARRLGKRDWLRLRQKTKGSLDVRLSGINCVYSRWIRLETPVGLPRLDGGLLENRRSVISLTRGGFSIDFIKHPENIDDWDPNTDEGKQPPIPIAPDKGTLVAPVVVSVQPLATASKSVYLRVKITDPHKEAWSLAVRYRLQDAGGGTPGEWVMKKYEDFDTDGTTITVSTNPVPGDTLLEVQAAWFTSKNKYSPWSVTATITAASDPNAPGIAQNSDAVGGSGQATYSWTTPTSANFSYVRLYHNTVNNFATATAVSGVVYGFPSTNYSKVVTGLIAGNHFGWVLTHNASGIAGTPAATGIYTVT